MSVINVDQTNFQTEILDSKKPILLDFWAPWCAPCRMVAPILEEIEAERPDIKVGNEHPYPDSDGKRQSQKPGRWRTA